MATTLLDHLRSVFTTPAVSDLARTLNEPNESTQRAVDGLLPTVTAGVVNQAQTNDGAVTLYRLLNSTPFDTDPSLKQLVDADTHRQKAVESGNGLLRQLYTDRPERLAQSTAQYSGIGTGSATTLTGLTMSVLMGYLHKLIKTRNLTEPQFAALLRDESSVVSAVPAALAGGLGWLIGTGTTRPETTTAIPTPTTTHVERDTDKAGTPWWRWLLYALALLLLLLLLRTCNRDKTETTTDTTENTGASTGVATDTVARDLNGNGEAASASGPEVRVGVDLPGGRRLNVAENSFNYSLAQYLAAKGSQPNKVFTFDNLTFETNSAQITAQAQPNVDDLIQIMQAYPSLNIRIEGHTDSTGPDDVNDPLSADRAEAVQAALVKAGIDAGRITTRERGEDKPVASNETEAGREKNRRIDVVVTKL